MREKDHSPRNMLPSPKQGCVYPALGLIPIISHVPYDLSAASATTATSAMLSNTTTTTTTTASAATRQQKAKRRSSYDQPLDLRSAHKRKTDMGGSDTDTDKLDKETHRYQLFFGTLNDGGKRLQEALSLLDWSGGYKVSAIQERHHMIYKDLLNELPVRMDRELNTDMYYLSCEEAKKLQINCPNGYYFDKVRPEHAEMINNLWSARHPGSLRLIELLITKNTNVGLYEKDSGKLCAWCLRLQSGFLGALEVLKTHQRRGLGLVVAAAISRLIAQQLNQDVTALVNMNNISAGKIFQKLNFQLQQEEHYFWSMSLPKDSNAIKWPANE